MISKVDDINKQEHKTSFTNQELEDKYKEFNAYKKEIEQKISIQEASLDNQESVLLKKIKKLEEKSILLIKREEKLNSEEIFISEKYTNSHKYPVNKETIEHNYETNGSQDEEFTARFIERQNLRKKELELISKEKEALSNTLSGFLSELN